MGNRGEQKVLWERQKKNYLANLRRFKEGSSEEMTPKLSLEAEEIRQKNREDMKDLIMYKLRSLDLNVYQWFSKHALHSSSSPQDFFLKFNKVKQLSF